MKKYVSGSRRLLLARLTGLVAACCVQLGWAQSGIYSCTDEQGRTITSDRPVPECLHRPQRELSRSGTTRRIIPPAPTAIELEQQAARQREAEAVRQRALNAIRRDQAMFTRYPTPQAHEAGRQEALAQTETVIELAEQRIVDLKRERKALDQEMEFYQKDPSRAPAKLHHDIQSNAESIEEQRRVIAAQQSERDRIQAQFDEEAERLGPMWETAAGTASAASQDAARQ